MRIKIQDPRQPEGFRIVDINRRKAIAEKCLNCSGFELTGRRDCRSTECQLHPYRLGLGKCDSSARNVAIRSYCRDCCMDGNGYLVSVCSSPDCPLYPYRMTTIDRSIEFL